MKSFVLFFLFTSLLSCSFEDDNLSKPPKSFPNKPVPKKPLHALPPTGQDLILFPDVNYRPNKDSFSFSAAIGNLYYPDSLIFTVNGLKMQPDSNGRIFWQSSSQLMYSTYVCRVTAEYIDPFTEQKVKQVQDIRFPRSGRFGLANEHGKYLYRGRKSEVKFYTEFYCGSRPIIKIKNGSLQKTGSRTYSITPNTNAHLCWMFLEYCGFELVYEYEIKDGLD